jgi:Cysteine-rich secretory protein family
MPSPRFADRVMRGILGPLAGAALAACAVSCGGGEATDDAGSDGGAVDARLDAPAVEAATLLDFQKRNLDDINMYRATLHIAPVTLDPTLDTFAQQGTVEESMNHMPHAHFISSEDGGALWHEGFKTAAGENQGDPTGWPILSHDPATNEIDQIDAIIKDMYDEGPGDGEAHGHYENIMNPEFTIVGVGLLEVDNMLYLTNDFSN